MLRIYWLCYLRNHVRILLSVLSSKKKNTVFEKQNIMLSEIPKMKYKNILINHKTFSNSLLESFYALKIFEADNVFLVFFF